LPPSRMDAGAVETERIVVCAHRGTVSGPRQRAGDESICDGI